MKIQKAFFRPTSTTLSMIVQLDLQNFILYLKYISRTCLRGGKKEHHSQVLLVTAKKKKKNISHSCLHLEGELSAYTISLLRSAKCIYFTTLLVKLVIESYQLPCGLMVLMGDSRKSPKSQWPAATPTQWSRCLSCLCVHHRLA